MKKLLPIFLILAAPASAQILKDNKTEAMRFGETSGRMSGSAYFCEVDDEDLDVFIALSQARINSIAIDRADRIAGQLSFSNNYSLWASEPPEEGCKKFLETFYRNYAHLFEN